MKKERAEIGLGYIQLNEGQLPWLPKNPRTWTQTDIDRTAASIKEDPDFLEDRPLLVVSLRDTPYFVVFAGNLRHEGALAAKRNEVPCVVYCPKTEEDYETIRRRAMKDNGSFGAWDYDALANEWGDLPLTEWGVPAWDPEKVDEGAVDALFEEQGGGLASEPLKVQVEVPATFEDNLEDIMAAIRITLEQWPGCSVK